jgi:glycosyltransferase involved in cell wall biosynthesis
MSAPLLSVIIPVYNVEKYLRQCVDSILSIDGDMELVLINDGSTDRSGDICDDYAARNPRIRAVHKENGGLSSARNAGISEARGRFVQFVDSDDWIECARARQLLQILESGIDDIYLIDGRYEFRSASAPMRRLPIALKGSYPAVSLLWKMKEHNRYAVEACRSIVRRELILNKGLRFREFMFREDEDWTPRVYVAAASACYTSIDLYRYRQRKSSITRRGDKHIRDVAELIGRQAEMLARAQGDAKRFFANNIVDLFQYIVITSERPQKQDVRKVYRIIKTVPWCLLCMKQRINKSLYRFPSAYRMAFKLFRSAGSRELNDFFD